MKVQIAAWCHFYWRDTNPGAERFYRKLSDRAFNQVLRHEISSCTWDSATKVVTSPQAQIEMAAIAEFDRRYGQNLVVGAAQVTSLAAARSAMWAGARFIITPGVDDALVHFAQRYGLFCLPQLTNLRELQQFGQRDLELALIAPQVTPLLAATPIDPRRTVAVITAEPALVDAAQLGVTALACGDLLFPTTQWSHAQIITQARRLRTRWSQLVLGQLKV